MIGTNGRALRSRPNSSFAVIAMLTRLRRPIAPGTKTALSLLIATGFILGLVHAPLLHAQDKPASGTGRAATKPFLRMSEGIVCDTINGYDDYEPLPGAALTSDEKLLVYYRPLDFHTSFDNGSYQAHLTQDVQVRKRGAKKVLWQKLKMVEYLTPKQDLPPSHLYMRNTISLKGLEPGEYDLIIILHDENNEGRTATQIVKFRVIPAADPRKEEKAKDTGEKKEKAKEAPPDPQ